jgi:GNAT superfamily N-acetyltransferase
MARNVWTLEAVAARPEVATAIVRVPGNASVLYRPLLPSDVDGLAAFLASLSPATRRFWELDAYDRGAAQELCDAIGRYDKLRLVAVGGEDSSLLALFEFSFGLVAGDHARYRAYGIPLDGGTTCRFGPCVRDDWQGRGLASALMPPTLAVARRFGRRTVILWGGVLKENARAIRFYEKHGFRTAGSFREPVHGNECLDMFHEL